MISCGKFSGNFFSSSFIRFMSCAIQSTNKSENVVVSMTGKDWKRKAADEAPIVKKAFNNQTVEPINKVLLNTLLFCHPFSNTKYSNANNIIKLMIPVKMG